MWYDLTLAYVVAGLITERLAQEFEDYDPQNALKVITLWPLVWLLLAIGLAIKR